MEEHSKVDDQHATPAFSKFHRLLHNAQRYAPVTLGTLFLARLTCRAILARTGGEPGVPLDDAYIHFQYARALAEGRFYAFQAGEGYTSGATSLLWPALLAPFYLVGFRDTAIIWIAWTFGWGFLALLAIETKRLASRLVGHLPAIGAAAAVMAFGGHLWFAASGMEVTFLAWSMARSARLASEWQETPSARSAAARNQLLLFALMGPLIRPEGTLSSLVLGLTLLCFPAPTTPRQPAQFSLRSRLWGLVAWVGPTVPPLLNWALTGQFATTTTLVKWMPLNPYYGGANLGSAVRANLDIFFHTLLDGSEWSAIFVPHGGNLIALAAFVCIGLAGVRSTYGWRAALVLVFAAAMMLPTTYMSFLWNRLRYLWPFAFAWCIALACLARMLGDFAGVLRPRFSSVAGLLAGIPVGLLAHHLSWALDDVANSAHAIHNQQVILGRWARDHLPIGSRIGVNDTGALAYFSGHPTFDVVGLTTPSEARYWVAGPGSRFEHYEQIHRKRPEALPTHFIVYPQWMACDAILGRELTRATVTDQTILGGPTMVAYEARYDLLHTGRAPEFAPHGRLLDELDVSDLESEEAHRFDVIGGGGVDTDNHVMVKKQSGEMIAADGGRRQRHRDLFFATLTPLKTTYLVARWSAPDGASLRISQREERVSDVEIPPTDWIEFTVPLNPQQQVTPVEIVVASQDHRRFGTMHYWVYAPEP